MDIRNCEKGVLWIWKYVRKAPFGPSVLSELIRKGVED